MQVSYQTREQLLGEDVTYLTNDGNPISIGARYFPNQFDKEVGDSGMIKLVNGELIEMSRFHDSRITSALSNQTQGCTDIQVPIKFKYNNALYVYIFDGAGEGPLLFQYDTYNHPQIVLDLLVVLDLNEDDW